MLYSETIDYLYGRLPVFQKQGASALKVGLGGIVKFCDYLGNPQNNFKSIHIAGTNGKGSTSHMLASILQESGYNTGLYTSPHLIDFRERIRRNGKVITKSYVTNFVKKHQKFIESNSFSFFEVTVALAFQYFSDNNVEIAVIEVGLGGRLDSTNIINPILAVITNISIDHAAILGDTLPQIASEKAGIIKKNIPTVISFTQSEIASVFKLKAAEENSLLSFADQEFTIGASEIIKNQQIVEIIRKGIKTNYSLDLLGSYQKQNLLGVLMSVETLISKGYKINELCLKKGLSNVMKNTGLMGRWQTLNNKPLTICDTGHNEAGIKEVLQNIKRQKFDQLHIVIGFVNDKEIDKILQLLPQNGKYYFCQADIPRALESDILAKKAMVCKLLGTKYKTVPEAYLAAQSNAKLSDFIFVGGSTFIVADLLTFLQKK
jgi:dihydrofolate synthase / folylpolyglutamate synthase